MTVLLIDAMAKDMIAKADAKLEAGGTVGRPTSEMRQEIVTRLAALAIQATCLAAKWGLSLEPEVHDRTVRAWVGWAQACLNVLLEEIQRGYR